MAGAANFTRGQIVNFNPQSRMFTLRTGTGAAAREQQFRFGNDTRFFAADRLPIKDLKQFNGFRNGTDVWFRNGSGEQADFLNEMRLFDPSEPIMKGNIMNGRIVSIDPKTGMIVVRTGRGAEVRDRRFHVDHDTRFFGPDLMRLNDGLAFSGFQTGAPVWFTPGVGTAADTLGGISLADPSAQVGEGATGPAPAASGAPAAANSIVRGVIVAADPKANTLKLTVGEGTNERQVTLNVSPDTHYFGADRKPLSGGLAFRGFRAGADVWFATTTGDLSGNIIDLSLADPTPLVPPPSPPSSAAPARTSPPEDNKVGSKFVAGKVVALDADERTITVKIGSGDEAREKTFSVASDAEFFGPERQPLSEGLLYKGLHPGVSVWLRVGTGELANIVRSLRMYDPSQPEKDH
jgi:hypothetical protein